MTTEEKLAYLDLVRFASERTEFTYERVADTNGGEWEGPCPFCGEGDDRFKIWPKHPDQGKGWFWCRRCKIYGDAINWIQEKKKLNYKNAKKFLDFFCLKKRQPYYNPPSPTHQKDQSEGNHPDPSFENKQRISPPSYDWQKHGKKWIDSRHDRLFGSEGAEALKWLTDHRKLDKTVIQEAKIGFNPENKYEPRDKWGLPPTDEKNSVWLPSGIVIPYFVDGALWKISIRRLKKNSQSKYVWVKGSQNALYLTDPISCDQPLVLVEGVFDALSIEQETSENIQAAAAGTTTGARKPIWETRLHLPSEVLLAFDRDEFSRQKGDRKKSNPYEYWAQALQDAKLCPPWWEDPNQMLQDGADLQSWINSYQCKSSANDILIVDT